MSPRHANIQTTTTRRHTQTPRYTCRQRHYHAVAYVTSNNNGKKMLFPSACLDASLCMAALILQSVKQIMNTVELAEKFMKSTHSHTIECREAKSQPKVRFALFFFLRRRRRRRTASEKLISCFFVVFLFVEIFLKPSCVSCWKHKTTHPIRDRERGREWELCARLGTWFIW